MVTPGAFHKQLRRLGLPLMESGNYYGYSLALGSAEVSLHSLTNAYRTLANGGRWSSTTLFARGKRASPAVLDPGAAFIVGDILSDSLARARTFGSDSVLGTRFCSAVKTGTSKDMRDNWAVGWSQRYTVGVWVGNASGAPMWDVSGTSGAAPIWSSVMQFLHSRVPSAAPKPPTGVVPATVDFAAALQARIVAPANRTIIALDPDIPPSRQRLSLQASAANLRWRVDGKPLATGNSAQWQPWPGGHTIQITDSQGHVLDEVRLEVRGAGVRALPPKQARAGTF